MFNSSKYIIINSSCHQPNIISYMLYLWYIKAFIR